MPSSNLHPAGVTLKILPDDDYKVQELKLKIAHLEGIQSAMPDPYYIRDMDYNIILWPDAIARLTGFSEEEAKKLKCYNIFKASVCPPNSDCPTQNCIQKRQFLKDVSVDVYHKDGSTIHSLVSNAGVYDENGNPIGAVEVVKCNTEIQQSMNSIGSLIKGIESASSSLIAVIGNLEDISKNVNDKAQESLENIKTGMKAFADVNNKVDQSSKYAGEVKTNIHTINNSMKFSVDKISALKAKSEMIIEFVAVIQEIAAKTNLLAINASIEAAHAGESGRGFKVVADGIRELSKSSNESADSIKNTIDEISKLIKETIISFNTTEKNVDDGSNNISELLGFAGEIDSAAKILMNNMDTIENAVTSTSSLGSAQSQRVGEVEKVGNDLSDIARNLKEEFDKVFNAIKKTEM